MIARSPQETKMIQKLTTLGHRTAFNNKQSPYRIVSYESPWNDNLKRTFFSILYSIYGMFLLNSDGCMVTYIGLHSGPMITSWNVSYWKLYNVSLVRKTLYRQCFSKCQWHWNLITTVYLVVRDGRYAHNWQIICLF